MVGSIKEGFDFAQFALLSRGVVLRQLWTQCGLACLGVKIDVIAKLLELFHHIRKPLSPWKQNLMLNFYIDSMHNITNYTKRH